MKQPETTRLENSIMVTKHFDFQGNVKHTSYSYEMWGHIGYINMAAARAGFKPLANSGHQGWSNTRVVVAFPGPDSSHIDALNAAYNAVLDEKHAEIQANKGKPKAPKPAPKPRAKKAEKPLKKFRCFVDQKACYNYYCNVDGVEGLTPAFVAKSKAMYREYPVVEIEAKSSYAAKELYEKQMDELGKAEGWVFRGGLWIKAKEIKEQEGADTALYAPVETIEQQQEEEKHRVVYALVYSNGWEGPAIEATIAGAAISAYLKEHLYGSVIDTRIFRIDNERYF